MSRSRIRASTLRNLVDGYSQTSGQPAPAQNAPREKFQVPQQIGPESVRSQSLTNNQMVDRTRSIGFPIGAATIRTGAPVLGLQGGATLYRAWSFATGVVNEIVFETFIPKDLATLSGPDAVFTLLWTNLGAGNGNVRWEIDYTYAKDAVTLNASTGSVFGIPVAPAQNLLSVSTFLSGTSPTTIPWNIAIVTLRRKGTDVTDTLANAVGVLGLTLDYSGDM